MPNTSVSNRRRRTPRTGASSTGFNSNVQQELADLMDRTPIKSYPVADRPAVILRKLIACQHTFAQTHANEVHLKAKEHTMFDLIETVSLKQNLFSSPTISKQCVALFAKNVFRTQPPRKPPVVIDLPEPPDNMNDPNWASILPVYEFFRLFVSNELPARQAKRLISPSFILRCVELCRSHDFREREALKTIIHRIYGKFMALRSAIRKSIQYVFFLLIFERESINGIAELLEILGSIINGFSVPLKKEHTVFLHSTLLRLLKANAEPHFHLQLNYCLTEFTSKDPSHAPIIMQAMLRAWPCANVHKEIHFIQSSEEILTLARPADFKKLVGPVFQRFALCVVSPYHQLSERTLFLWNNETLVEKINETREEVFKIMLKPITQNTANHWNRQSQNLAYNCLKLFMETDPVLFENLTNQIVCSEESRQAKSQEIEKTWRRLISDSSKTLKNRAYINKTSSITPGSLP